MAEWSFVLTDRFGVNVGFYDLAGKLTRELNGATELELELGLEEHGADRFTTGKLLRAYRDGELRFHGQVLRLAKKAESAVLEIDAGDPLKVLEQRFLRAGAQRKWSNADAGRGIAKDLIDDAAGSGGEYHHLEAPLANLTASVKRDRLYDVGKSIAEAVQELADVDDGYFYRADPVAYDSAFTIGGRALVAAAELHVLYPSAGLDRSGSVRFEYGAGTLANLADFEDEELPPLNIVQAMSDAAAPEELEDSSSVDTYGAFMASESFSGVKRQATLKEHARDLRRPSPRRTFAVEASPVSPFPWDDFEVGDLVSVRAERGALSFAGAARVNSFTVELPEDGSELLKELVLEEASA